MCESSKQKTLPKDPEWQIKSCCITNTDHLKDQVLPPYFQLTSHPTPPILNRGGAPMKCSLQARWTRLKIQMDWISMLVSNIASCSVTRGKTPPPISSCDLTSASFADDWKSNERETGSCLWHPVGMPPGFTKQTGNGRVRLSLVRPSSSRTAGPARTYVPLICGWGVGATHHPEKGVCAHTHAWACALAKYKEGTCADNVEHLVFVVASLGCSRSMSRCKGTCTQRKADGRFSMRAHVHIIWLPCFGDALKHSSSF